MLRFLGADSSTTVAVDAENYAEALTEEEPAATIMLSAGIGSCAESAQKPPIRAVVRVAVIFLSMMMNV